MSKKSLPWWQRLDLIRQYWPLILFVVAATAFLYTLPGRLASSEKRIEKVNEDVDDLKGWAREIQGYTKAMNQQQQASNQISRPQASQPASQLIPPTTPKPPTLKVEWVQTEGGEWFCLRSDGASWWPNEEGNCE